MKKAFRKPLRTLLAGALVLAAAPTFAQQAPFSQTVFFGDSLTDSGYYRPVLVQAYGPDAALLGRFTTNPGLVWAEWVADYYGTSATPNGNGQTGTDYAAGGARVGVDNATDLGVAPSIASQVSGYLAANGGAADPNALYTVWGGANDLFTITSPDQAPAVIGGAVTAEVGIIGALQQAGARYILVPNIPDVGLTPRSRAGGAAGMAQGTAIATAYNDALYAGLASQGLSVIPVDTFHFLQEVAADPGLYGFANVTDPGCSPAGPAAGSSIVCSPQTYVDPNAPDKYLFADGIHPSSAAHQMLSQLAISMIEGPRQIAVLSHSAAVVGAARADRVAQHATGDGQGNGRWWADVRGDFQRYGDGDMYDGAGPSLTAGIDWNNGSLVYGGFVGYGRQSLDWGRNGGDFTQKDSTLGGFIGWHGETGGWVNGQVSYTKLGYDINRHVVLGPATRNHRGSPDGSNVALGVNGGWEFGDGAFRQGPVGSLLWQKISIDGYAESDPGMSSSLAYPDQDYKSLRGALGWQASYDVSDGFKPYARLTWNREFKDTQAQAFARSQSIAGSLPYAVPGVEFDRSFGNLLMGVRSDFGNVRTNLGASLGFAQSGGDDTGVFFTIDGDF